MKHQIKTIQKIKKKLNDDVALFIQTCKKFMINNNILQHKNEKLQKILQDEKKCQKWNKKMNLFFKNEPKQVMFFLFAKIIAVQAHQRKLKTQKKQKKFDKKLKCWIKAIEKKMQNSKNSKKKMFKKTPKK